MRIDVSTTGVEAMWAIDEGSRGGWTRQARLTYSSLFGAKIIPTVMARTMQAHVDTYVWAHEGLTTSAVEATVNSTVPLDPRV
jgi:hypothetical protein